MKSPTKSRRRRSLPPVEAGIEPSARAGAEAAALLEAAEPFVRLVEGIGTGIALLTPTDGRIAYANDACGRLLGFSPALAKGQLLRDYLSDRSSREIDRLVEHAGSGEGFRNLTVISRGRPWARIALAGRRIEIGGMPAIQVILEDLESGTRLDEGCAAAKLSNSIFHNAAEAFLLCDARGVILRANYGAYQLIGRNPVGQPFDDAYPLEILAATKGNPWPRNASILGRLGKFHDLRGLEVLLRQSPLRPAQRLLASGRAIPERSGAVHRYLLILTDITRLREAETGQRRSEERFRRLVDLSPDAILLESDRKIVYANPSALALFGIPQEDRVLGRSMTEFVTPEDRPMVVEALQQLERVALGSTLPLVRLLDSTTFVEMRAVRFPSEDPPTALLILHNITDRKEAERQIRELNAGLERRVEARTAQLQEAMRDLNGFAYSVAHDLRAPLRAMQGFSHMLSEEYGDRLDEQGRDYTRRIAEASQRMDALIGDLLAYSRISREELVLEPVDLPAALRAALLPLEPAIRERDAAVDVDLAPRWVTGHRVMLTQVLLNLVSNALKFVAPGVRPKIRIRTEPREPWTRVWVEDNGIGIETVHHDRIFRVFERLHPREVYPGTGMGLAIVHRALERMGGRVGVESTPGRGSRFWIELPTADAPAGIPLQEPGR